MLQNYEDFFEMEEPQENTIVDNSYVEADFDDDLPF